MRRVGEVEGLHAELKPPAFPDGKLTKDPEVPICEPRSAQLVQRRIAEACFGNRLEGERIEVGLAWARAAKDLHRGLHLIGGLAAARQSQRPTPSTPRSTR